MNSHHEAVNFRIPESPTGRTWRRVIDTAATSPNDFQPEGQGDEVEAGAILSLIGFSLIVLLAT